MEYAVTFARDVDLDGEERNYKLKLAERLTSTREAYLEGSEDWFERLRKDIASVNLMHWFPLAKLTEVGRDRPDEISSIVGLLWRSDVNLNELTEFGDRLKGLQPKGLLVGDIACFASILLLGRNPTEYPPYRTAIVKKFLKLVGWADRGANDQVATRYQLLLEAMDEILRLAPKFGIKLRDRLDAQGLMWTVMNVKPGASWSVEEAADFRAWRGDKDKVHGRRAWLVRQGQGGISMLQSWQTDSFVSTRAQHLGSPDPGSSLADVQKAVNEGYPHTDYAERKIRAAEYYRFLKLMKPDDLVLTQHEGQLYLGVIIGDAHYVEDEAARLRRDVEWQPAAVDSSALTAPLPRLLEEQGAVVDLTEALAVVEQLFEEAGQMGDEELERDETQPQPAIVPQLRDASDGLAAALHVERADLQEIVDLLQTRNQIVFYGPPGTGKTYLAGKIARYLAGEEHGDHVKTVQFHPSYAYEDFFEGYRPVQGEGGQVGFSLEPGPLRRIAAEASAEGNQDKPFFLIIDEVNRGNLAKVFGELYFLLEYRDQSINLQYSPTDTFVLPPNLFIIATMNTADRSIAMVDAAIRRRFAFVELHPQEGMIEGMLARYLSAQRKDPLRAQLLNALNAELGSGDRDLMIGPSYFMKEHAETEAGLERIWRYELLPLLEEHHFGRLSREQVHERFGLAAIRRAAERRVRATDSAEDASEERQNLPGTPVVTGAEAETD